MEKNYHHVWHYWLDRVSFNSNVTILDTVGTFTLNVSISEHSVKSKQDVYMDLHKHCELPSDYLFGIERITCECFEVKQGIPDG